MECTDKFTTNFTHTAPLSALNAISTSEVTEVSPSLELAYRVAQALQDIDQEHWYGEKLALTNVDGYWAVSMYGDNIPVQGKTPDLGILVRIAQKDGQPITESTPDSELTLQIGRRSNLDDPMGYKWLSYGSVSQHISTQIMSEAVLAQLRDSVMKEYLEYGCDIRPQSVEHVTQSIKEVLRISGAPGEVHTEKDGDIYLVTCRVADKDFNFEIPESGKIAESLHAQGLSRFALQEGCRQDGLIAGYKHIYPFPWEVEWATADGRAVKLRAGVQWLMGDVD